MKQNKLLLLLLTMLLPMMASAAAVKINGIYYNLVSKTKKAEVTSNPDMYSGKVVIPKTVTYEGMKCNVTSIGSCAFWGCSGLTSVTIPNSVTSIGEAAFWGCSGLTSVTIPNSVTSIGEAAFSGCTSLTSVTIPTSVTSIGKSAFYWCTGLTSVIIPSSVTSIGIDAFCGCSGLISVAIPNSVTTIDDMAFQSCNGLTTVSFGSGIQYIGYKAFAGCPELTDVRCYAENVPETQSDAFDGSYIEYATLHVPKGCLDAYKAVEPWKNFKEKVEMVDAKVKLSKTKATIEKGKTLTLKATITPTDLPDKSVTWKSSNTKIAKVTSDGEVIAMKAGTATITCTSNATGLKGTCKVTVGYVKLDKTEAVVEKGSTVALTATVYPSSLSDRSVTWESSDTKIATVTSKGKVSGVKAGIVTITCTSKATGQKATCTVTVGYVKLDKTEVTVEKGKTLTLTPTVYPSKLTDKSVTWKSSNTSVATVTSAGKVKGVKAGTTFITCTSVATGLSTTCLVTVGYVKLDQTKVSVAKGKTVTLTAKVYPSKVNQSVTWTSSDKTVATVTSAGKVKGVSAGTATITCTSEVTGLSTTCTVTVTGSSTTRSLEGDDDETTGVKAIDEAPDTAPFDVYDLSGRKVRHQVTSLNGLPKGIYIVNGKKVMIK